MDSETIKTPGKRRVTLIYAVLAALVAIVIPLSFAAGKSKEDDVEIAIAGGYDVAEPESCLGASFDLLQSGRFVNLENRELSTSGKLEFRGGGGPGTLDGDVTCQDGSSLPLVAEADGESLTGTVGGTEIAATKEREVEPGRPPQVIPGSLAEKYALAPRSTCLGPTILIEEEDSGALLLIAGKREAGEVTYSDGELTGTVECAEGGGAAIAGEAAGRTITISLTPEDPAIPAEKLVATAQREFGNTLAAFFLAVVVVMLAARLGGALVARFGFPRVMGEVVAGIALGPTVLGAISPELQVAIFPSDLIPIIGVVANLGLIFYMFLVGLELDAKQLEGRAAQAAVISNASVALPMALGVAVAVPIYTLVGPDQPFIAFSLFMGVAMSITAFPVLARILVERRMLKRPVGALAMASAAIDDVTAWFLIALALAVAVAGSVVGVLETVALALAFCAVMFLGVRPLIGRVSDAYDEAGRVPSGWIVAIFAGILLAAFTTEEIGIALIFGAFVMGMVMPRNAELTEDVTGRIEDFVVTLLLPLFFAYTGLRTDIGLLDRPELWLMTIALILVAIVGKLVGAAVAARLTGFSWRASGVIGTLMNTRGLTELIVLNIALEKGVISPALFAALVIMALVTTFMAGPLLNLLDPENKYGAPVEEEFASARQDSEAEFPAVEIPEKAILLAPQTGTGLEQLRAIAEPLATAEPRRELILARLVRPPRGAAAGVRGGLQTENRLLDAAMAEVRGARDELVADGIAARAVALISSDAGADITHVASDERIDLVLTDGRRPLLGEGVPRGEVGAVLSDAPCDVAVLVAREGLIPLRDDPEAPIVVPFGGAEHDWAALELGAWISSATSRPLKLLGAAGSTDETSKLTRLLADAGLLVQQYAGIVADPMIAEPGRSGIVDASSGASLLVVGLSERWRTEGLGAMRSDLAKIAPAPVLFVRRGERPGALAPKEDVTRFTWSSPGVGGPGLPTVGPGEAIRPGDAPKMG